MGTNSLGGSGNRYVRVTWSVQAKSKSKSNSNSNSRGPRLPPAAQLDGPSPPISIAQRAISISGYCLMPTPSILPLIQQQGDPYAFYTAMRREHPVAYDGMLGM